jgi:hypothetical protein
MSFRILFALVAVAFLSLGSFAQADGNPDNWCRAGFFAKESDNFMIGSAKGAKNSKIYFYNDDAADCPDSEKCKAKAYVVPGDQILVSKARGNFGCAWFAPNKGHPTVGWIKMDSFRFLEMVHDASPQAWLGEWKYADNSINFTHNKLAGWLNVTGDALWKGLGDNVHIGELDGRAEPKDGILNYSDGDDEFDCKATMRLVGSYLVVSDNLKCGGLNVSFSGVYKRKAEARSK